MLKNRNFHSIFRAASFVALSTSCVIAKTAPSSDKQTQFLPELPPTWITIVRVPIKTRFLKSKNKLPPSFPFTLES